MQNNQMEGNINESYYLCEGLWLDKESKQLIDKNKNDAIIDIKEFENKVYIFIQEVKEWIFHPMDILLNDDKNNKSIYKPFKNSIFILHGVFSYLEKIERYKIGRNYDENNSQSTKILMDSFQKIFKQNNKDYCKKKIENILNATRNSLAHTGNIGDKVLVNYDYENSNAVEYIGSNKEFEKVELNPSKMIEEIKIDFQNYLKKLINPNETELRENFEKVFDKIYEEEMNYLGERK
jgi:hypothetical protein